MTKKILDLYTAIETIITRFIRMIVAIASFGIGELAPLVAPLAPSFSIYLAMSQRLHMPQYIALIAAGTIEIVGMYSAKISVRCYRWNTARNKTEAAVPQGLSIAMTAVFYVVVLCLALTIELIPSLTALIFPAFTLISVSVYVNMAIDQNLRKLETDKAAELELRLEKNGLSADIRQAKKELDSVKTAAHDLAQNIQRMTAERDALAAEMDRQRARLTRLTPANETDIAPKKNPVLNQTAAERMDLLNRANDTKQALIDERRQAIIDLKTNEPEITQPDLTERLNEMGYEVSLSTVKRDIKQLNGSIAR